MEETLTVRAASADRPVRKERSAPSPDPETGIDPTLITTDPVMVPNTHYYRTMLRDGDLVLADGGEE